MLFASIVLLAVQSSSCSEKLKPALGALQQKNPSQASAVLEANRTECSGTSFYSELMGAANELSGNSAAAEDAYREAVSREPKDVRLRFKLGVLYLKNGKAQEAIRELRATLVLDPSNAAGWKYLIGAYAGLNDWQNVSLAFESMGAFVHPRVLKDPAMTMWLARALVETKKTERIDSLISPDDPAMTPPLLFTLGGLFAEHRMYREAVRFLSRIPEKDADDAVYFNLGEAYSHLQEFDKARICYFHAIDKHPGHVEAYFHVGLDYASSGQQRKSTPWLAQAHQFAPDRTDISYALAEQLINLGYFDSADELLKKAASDQPDNALIQTACGDLKSAEGQVDAAIRSYEEALVKTPGLIQALIGLAHVQITQVKYEEAQQSLELALSEAPDNAVVEGALGLLENKQQHWDAAAVHLENAWKADRANSQIALELARAYRQTGKLTDALRLLTSIEPALRQSPAFHLEFSQLYRQMHRADESKAELDAFNALQKREESSLRFDKPRTYVF